MVRVGVGEVGRDLAVGVSDEHGDGDREVDGGDLDSDCG
jgi:hypothetical protein